jgi:hypothetical protein
VRAGVVGLGFGTGLGHDVVSAVLVEAAASRGLGLVEVPRDVPFIAISKAVSKALAADEYAALTRTSEAQIIVLAQEFDGFASSEVDATEVAKAEQALNRSMDSPSLRAELWLALHSEGQ